MSLLDLIDEYRHSLSASPDYVCERLGEMKIIWEDPEIVS
jgi:hypothetical protein